MTCRGFCTLCLIIAFTSLLGQAEASPTQVLSIEIFSIYIYMCCAYVRPSYRIESTLHSNFTNSTKIASGHVGAIQSIEYSQSIASYSREGVGAKKRTAKQSRL